jgi:hypothetical protein
VKNRSVSAATLVLGILLGLAVGRLYSPFAADAQTAAPSSGPMMPMHGGAMGNCPAMQSMMDKVKSPADRALMQSMMSMHQSMQSMQMTGDADHDFMVMMIPHHQVAIAMANAEIQNGKDPKVLALAKAIIASQQKEVDEMNAWLK